MTVPEPREAVYIAEGVGRCEVHDWTIDDFRTRLIPLMRERYYGKGGLTACVKCLRHARDGVRQIIER